MFTLLLYYFFSFFFHFLLTFVLILKWNLIIVKYWLECLFSDLRKKRNSWLRLFKLNSIWFEKYKRNINRHCAIKKRVAYIYMYRNSHPEVFLGKRVLKICSRFTGENPCRSAISVKLQLYWNRTSAWVFSCKSAAYFQNTFS